MLKNKEIELLIKMENLIGCNEKILFDNNKTEVTKSDFIDFMNLIESEIQTKRKQAEKANAYNKAHKEKHAKYNKEYYHRKKALQKA